MQKILVFTVLLITFSSCTLNSEKGLQEWQKESQQPVIQSKLVQNNTCPVNMGAIYVTGTKIAIDCNLFVDQNPIRTVSAEVNYDPQKNLINLSIEESDQIVKQLLEKQEQENKKQNNTGVLIQGNWKAVYNPPKYPDGYDSITVTLSGKEYILPGLYGSEEKKKYLQAIVGNSECIEESGSVFLNVRGEKMHDNVSINGKYYSPPNRCYITPFGIQLLSFSPDGKYIIYNVLLGDGSETRIVNIKTGKIIFHSTGGGNGITLIDWTKDKTQMIFETFDGIGGDIPGGLYITKKGDFSNYEKIQNERGIISLYGDDKYVYTLEEYNDYDLRILDINTFKEVYTRIVKK